jgi:flagellar biosynthesis/type III secretory pathway protein FliH
MGVLWLRFLQEVEERTTEVAAELRKNPHIRKALKICEVGAFTEAELAAYEKYWDAVRVERTLIADSKKEGWTEGKAEGIEEGKAEGIEEGKAEGRAEGLIDFVRSCKRNGLSLGKIQKITNLSEEKILKILSA